jgi:cation transport ATPase
MHYKSHTSVVFVLGRGRYALLPTLLFFVALPYHIIFVFMYYTNTFILLTYSSNSNHHLHIFTLSSHFILSSHHHLHIFTLSSYLHLHLQWRIVYELLTEPMPIMLWIAAFTEAAIQNYPDMSILLAIQVINASLGFYEIVKAGDAVAALKASLKPQATVKRDGKWQNVHAGIVVPGDLVLLASGSAIPADCIVNEGVIEVDQAALTG